MSNDYSSIVNTRGLVSVKRIALEAKLSLLCVLYINVEADSTPLS